MVGNLILTQLERGTHKKMEGDLQQKMEDNLQQKMEYNLTKMEDNLIFFLTQLKRRPQKNGRQPRKKKERQTLKKKSTKINLIGCDTIVNLPSVVYICLHLN